MFDERVLKRLLKNSPIGYAYIDVFYDEFNKPFDFQFIDYNPSFGKIMEIDERVIGKSLSELDDNYILVHEVSSMLKIVVLEWGKSSISECFESSGQCFDVFLFPDNNSSIIVQVINRTEEVKLRNELIKQAEDLKYLSYHDKLTGLYNRAFFEEEMKRLDTERNLPISIIMGDTNGLKLINDVFGHAAGDNLIKSSANILSKSCRKEDVVARWGGDEFVILLPNTSSKSALEIINRIKNNFRTEKFDLDYLNLSLGYSVKRYSNTPITEVLKEAENNMYKNKAIEGKEVRKLIVGSMVDYLYQSDIEAKLHMDRLKRYSVEIGKNLNLVKDDMDKLNIICEIHDIGNISVDRDILSKLGALTDDDWEEIKKHPEIGYRIAKSIPELSDVAEYILHHHERWDGNGYPHNLKEDEIPLLSRLFAVIDTFDAMTQEKTYRRAYSKEDAIEYLSKNAGKQFDPTIVEIFVNDVLDS